VRRGPHATRSTSSTDSDDDFVARVGGHRPVAGTRREAFGFFVADFGSDDTALASLAGGDQLPDLDVDLRYRHPDGC
jgi:hypothetical protein